MKVLYYLRGDEGKYPGGDMVQAARTAQEVAALGGVEVAMVRDRSEVCGRWDVVHVFNTTRVCEALDARDLARAMGARLVLSPIWHSRADLRRFNRETKGLPDCFFDAYSRMREAYYSCRSGAKLRFWPWRYSTMQAQALREADLLLPNSQAERALMESESGVVARRVVVVPNGVDLPVARDKGQEGRLRRIVCAGRIEPRKNQLRVIQAFREVAPSGWTLCFAGAANRSHGDYFRQFEAMIDGKDVVYWGSLAREELWRRYSESEACLLGSLFETTGLVAAEGVMQGCRLMVCDSPYTREYFGETAVYCDPYSITSLSAGIRQLVSGKGRCEAAHLTTWSKVGALTRDAYMSILRAS